MLDKVSLSVMCSFNSLANELQGLVGGPIGAEPTDEVKDRIWPPHRGNADNLIWSRHLNQVFPTLSPWPHR